MSTKNLEALPGLPLQDEEDVIELVQLTSGIGGAVEQILGAIGDDFHCAEWTRGWGAVLKRHPINSVRRNHPKSAAVKQVIGASTVAYQKSLGAGVRGPEALEGLLRALSAGLSATTPVLVLQTLENFTVAAGTAFKPFWEDLVVLVTSVQQIGFAEDGILQVAVKRCL